MLFLRGFFLYCPPWNVSIARGKAQMHSSAKREENQETILDFVVNVKDAKDLT